jgi:predicted phosphohydrolase
MLFQFCSDLHIEFQQNKDFLKKNPLVPKAEVLLLAGDIGLFYEIQKYKDFFSWISDNFRQTYWVPGNHEYYNYEMTAKQESFSERITDNLILTNNTVFYEGDVKIIASTLWSKIGDRNHGMIEYNMNDFRVIRYRGWQLTASIFNELHKNCLNFVTSELVKSDQTTKSIVLTHHIPTFLNYPERFKNDILNDAFAVELFDLIEKHGPDVWVYGHHHQNIKDFHIGKTLLVNNQLGYVKYGENEKFRRDAVFEI